MSTVNTAAFEKIARAEALANPPVEVHYARLARVSQSPVLCELALEIAVLEQKRRFAQALFEAALNQECPEALSPSST